MKETQPVAGKPLPWHTSLQFRLGLLLIELLVIGALCTWAASQFLSGGSNAQDAQHYATESGQRQAAQIDGIAQRIQITASTLTRLATDLPNGLTDLQQVVPQIVDHLGSSADLVANVGIWPEPNTLDPARQRASLLWVRDSTGTLQPRADYNDPATVPYTREKWYTPARYEQLDHCYWTPVFLEPLARLNVVTCAMPIKSAQGFIGVVTIGLSVARLAARISQITENDDGYSLLLDPGDQLLAMSASGRQRIGAGDPRNLAALAQSNPAYNALALTLHQQEMDLLASARHSASYSAASISALQQGTRDMSQLEAATALTQIWMARDDRTATQATATQRIEDDPVLGGTSYAASLILPHSGWQLLRITAANGGADSSGGLLSPMLLAIAAAAALTLLLLFVALQLMVIAPLRRMHALLSRAGTLEESLAINLDARSKGEIGRLAYWFNERQKQLRDLMGRAISSNAQAATESDSRRSAQEALSRAQERSTLLLQSVFDGVIVIDEHGRIEDMNNAAEQLIGTPLRNSRGRNFSDVFKARTAEGAALPDLAEQAIHEGKRMELAGGVQLAGIGGVSREIRLAATPLRAQNNRGAGAVIVFRALTTAAAGGTTTAAADMPLVSDRITGLPIRSACYRNIGALIAAARLKPAVHTLLAVNIDNLRRVNQVAGPLAGDQIIVKVGELLVSRSATLGQVYRNGGGEFGVLLENTDARKASTFAEALRKIVASTRIKWEDRSFDVTVSIGIMPFDGKTASAADVLCRADDACALAKQAGHNGVVQWTPAMLPEQQPNDQLWIQRIRAGLNQNLFHLTTQFILPERAHASDGAAFEVMLALEDEEGFWSTAGAFLPAAERHHLTHEVDRWVFNQTIAHLERNPEVAQRIAFIVINISAESLTEPALLEHIVQSFAQAPAVSPSCFCFQLDEETVFRHQQFAQTFCDVMRGVGCKLMVNHFNPRRASDFELLRRLPLDFVKIDSSEFSHVNDDAAQHILAESAINLARSLRKEIVISHLEENAQFDAWRRLGADYYQGFVVAKRTPAIFTAPA
ncbi:MAG: EAL domain-containing protein [Stenotrophobium sp.]